MTLKDKSGVDKMFVKKQPYQQLNTSCEFFPSFDASNFHTFISWLMDLCKLGQIVAILYFVRMCEGTIRRLVTRVV